MSVDMQGRPGVVLHVKSHVLNSRQGTVTLTADVADPNIWEKVIKKIGGKAFYADDDLPDAIMAALKYRHNQEVAELKKELEACRAAKDIAEASLAFERCNVSAMRQQLTMLRVKDV